MVAIVYGSSTLNTEYIAERLAAAFGSGNADMHNVKDDPRRTIESRSDLVLVTSTWGTGDLQDDWEKFFPMLESIDLSDKTVGLVGVGDQQNYPDTFCDSIAILYNAVRSSGARIVGMTNTDGYHFRSSRAVTDGQFVGLVLDEDNQADQTDERIREWVTTVSRHFASI